eukprot:1159515-Pelagomonas_calceolata.AAC.4
MGCKVQAMDGRPWPSQNKQHAKWSAYRSFSVCQVGCSSFLRPPQCPDVPTMPIQAFKDCCSVSPALVAHMLHYSKLARSAMVGIAPHCNMEFMQLKAGKLTHQTASNMRGPDKKEEEMLSEWRDHSEPSLWGKQWCPPSPHIPIG